MDRLEIDSILNEVYCMPTQSEDISFAQSRSLQERFPWSESRLKQEQVNRFLSFSGGPRTPWVPLLV